MSNFKQNTVETVGDAALTHSIIDRSIAELQDDITTSIAAQKFRGCNDIAKVIFPCVTSVGVGAFWQCTALKMADFSACVSIAQNAFYGCSALEALILRNEGAVSSITGNLSGTPIASGTGHIYVPSALVDTYKKTSGWSTYASQIRAIEDYPLVCDVYSWDGVFASIDNGTYKEVYKVGDTIPLDLGSEGVVNMQIAAFDADDKADGSGKAHISFISKEVLKTSKRMNAARTSTTDESGATVYTEGTGSIGGWEKSEMRTYMQDTILPLIPEEVRNRIVTVTKTHPAYNTSGSNFNQTTQDDVWIPDYNECFGSTSLYYPLFQDTSANRIKKKAGASSASNWWLRYAGPTDSFRYVNSSGSWSGNYSSFYASNSHGVVLGFCT